MSETVTNQMNDNSPHTNQECMMESSLVRKLTTELGTFMGTLKPFPKMHKSCCILLDSTLKTVHSQKVYGDVGNSYLTYGFVFRNKKCLLSIMVVPYRYYKWFWLTSLHHCLYVNTLQKGSTGKYTLQTKCDQLLTCENCMILSDSVWTYCQEGDTAEETAQLEGCSL